MAGQEDYPITVGQLAPEVLAEMLVAELSVQGGEMVEAIKAPLGAGFRDLIANPDLRQGIPLEEFGKLWVAMWQQAMREQKPYLDHLNQQGLIDSNAKLNLVPYNPIALPEGHVNDETFSIQQAMALARTYIENFDEIADQYSQMYDELGGLKLLERPRILHCGNHSDFFDTVMPNIFFANYFYQQHGLDVRHLSTLPIGSRVTTFEIKDYLANRSRPYDVLRGQSMYIPSLITAFSNYFVTHPTTENARVPGTRQLTMAIIRNAKNKIGLLKNGGPENIMIERTCSISPASGRDNPNGSPSNTPHLATLQAVAPPQLEGSITIPIAHNARGAMNNFLLGKPTRIKVAIGKPVPFIDGQDDKEVGEGIFRTVYSSLVPSVQ